MSRLYKEADAGTRPSLGCLGLIALWCGLMIATAGAAIFPSLDRIGAPFVCSGAVELESHTGSYQPGQTVVTRQVLCARPGAKESEDITMKATAASFAVYSLIAFAIMLLLSIPAVWRIASGGWRWLRGRRGDTAPGRAAVRGMPDGLPDRAGEHPAAAVSAAGRLAEIRRLRDAGLITNADYEAKKAEILSGL